MEGGFLVASTMPVLEQVASASISLVPSGKRHSDSVKCDWWRNIEPLLSHCRVIITWTETQNATERSYDVDDARQRASSLSLE